MSRRVRPPWSDDMEEALIAHSKTPHSKTGRRGFPSSNKAVVMAAAVLLGCLTMIGIHFVLD
jgi:hypothetical protein